MHLPSILAIAITKPVEEAEIETEVQFMHKFTADQELLDNYYNLQAIVCRTDSRKFTGYVRRQVKGSTKWFSVGEGADTEPASIGEVLTLGGRQTELLIYQREDYG